MQVKNMPRNQQKAVFANMGNNNGAYLSHLESAEKYHKRRDFLLKKHELSEDYEDKIVRVWNDKKLTYRQKMSKVNKLKAEAQKKLQSARRTEGEKTITSDIRDIRESKLAKNKNKAITIVEPPVGHRRAAFNAILAKKKLPSNNLYAYKGLLLTQTEYNAAVTAKHKGLPKGATLAQVPSGHNKRAFDAYILKASARHGLYVQNGDLVMSAADYKKGLARNARVRFPKSFRSTEKEPTDAELRTNKIRVGDNLKGRASIEHEIGAVDKRAGPTADGHFRTQHPYYTQAQKQKEVKEFLAREKKKSTWSKKDEKALGKSIVTEQIARGHLVIGTRKSTKNLTDSQLRARIKTLTPAKGKKTSNAAWGSIIEYEKELKSRKKPLIHDHTAGLSYKELKNRGHHLKPTTDVDGDGVPNKKDCRPLDSKKQDVALFIKTTRAAQKRAAKKLGKKAKNIRQGTRKSEVSLSRVVENIKYARSAKGREAAATRRLAAIRAKEEIVRTKARTAAINQEASAAEAKYKAEHPSLFTRARTAYANRKKKSIYD